MLHVNSSVCSFFSFVWHVTGEPATGCDPAPAAAISSRRGVSCARVGVKQARGAGKPPAGRVQRETGAGGAVKSFAGAPAPPAGGTGRRAPPATGRDPRALQSRAGVRLRAMWAAQRRCASALVSAAASVARGFAGRAHNLPRWAAGAQHEIKPGAPVSAAGLLALNTLKDNPGARQQARISLQALAVVSSKRLTRCLGPQKKRVGRGIGSGMGKTSTRGHKGQKARSGAPCAAAKPSLTFRGAG
jgi:hypothetical protein